MNATYLLPVRRTAFSKFEAWDFADYFKRLNSADCEVLVVDGSPGEIFAQHHEIWSKHCMHVMADPRFGYLNDKVNGIHTGVHAAGADKIILADDDIRYKTEDIERVCALLEQWDVVRPQNYFNELQFRTLVESARMLINRATLRTADYPGTCAFRRAAFLSDEKYDGDVLFDNEELIRHFARRRMRIAYENDFFILKRAPTFKKWLEQRPRQAYEDFGLRAKTVLFASILPLAALVGVFGGIFAFGWFLVALHVISVAIALIGRKRGLAARYFDWHAPFYAPVWVLERAVSTWLAFYWRLRYGGYPFGKNLLRKGIGRDWIEGGRIAASSSRE